MRNACIIALYRISCGKRVQRRYIGEPLGRSRHATHIYICGLKGMEVGVDEALSDVCRARSLDWAALKPVMRAAGRYHVETY
jgi:hypothetical protein